MTQQFTKEDYQMALDELPGKDDFNTHVGHESADFLYVYGDTILSALQLAIEHMKRGQWQDINTAPKDGETKALYGCFKNDKWYEQITKRGSGVGGLHVNVPTGFRSYTGATHWMPLPEPP